MTFVFVIVNDFSNNYALVQTHLCQKYIGFQVTRKPVKEVNHLTCGLTVELNSST
jgi:hypothetical protein